VPSDDGQAHTTTTVDRYLSSIYCIAGEGETVRPGRLAAWLGVSAPTVSDAIQRLARDGWVDVATDRSITLTTEGHRAASALVRRHRLLERWLVDVLAFDWVRADEEADSLSSGFSDAVIDELDRSLGLPATCPHGNPIPGRAPTYGELVSLATLEAGVLARVRRISEVAEHESRALLTLLGEHGICEGSTVEVIGPPHDDAVSLRSGDRTFSLPVSATRWMWVERLDRS
jgi:DtxR family transcriptional regulator, Mn-dependent transcriptional regulator